MLNISAGTPRQHAGEDTRWDFSVTIVFKTAALAFDENLLVPYKKALYPNEEGLKKEEQHRFELLLSHWDVKVKPESLER